MEIWAEKAPTFFFFPWAGWERVPSWDQHCGRAEGKCQLPTHWVRAEGTGWRGAGLLQGTWMYFPKCLFPEQKPAIPLHKHRTAPELTPGKNKTQAIDWNYPIARNTRNTLKAAHPIQSLMLGQTLALHISWASPMYALSSILPLFYVLFKNCSNPKQILKSLWVNTEVNTSFMYLLFHLIYPEVLDYSFPQVYLLYFSVIQRKIKKKKLAIFHIVNFNSPFINLCSRARRTRQVRSSYCAGFLL